MHENHSTQWAMSPPFIQWRCIIHIPQRYWWQDAKPSDTWPESAQVGISNLPISPRLLDNLRTELDDHFALGIPLEIPLESSIMGHMSTPPVEPIASPPVENSYDELNITAVDIYSSPFVGKTLPKFKVTQDATERLGEM